MCNKNDINYMRANALAQQLGVSIKTIYNWHNKGYFSRYIIGGTTFFNVEEVISALIELNPNQSKTSSTNYKKSGHDGQF